MQSKDGDYNLGQSELSISDLIQNYKRDYQFENILGTEEGLN